MSKLNVNFTLNAFEDYKFWQSHDKKIVKRINELIKSIQRNGVLDGIGIPEALKGSLSGFNSRRIDREHRLVYVVDDNAITIISCRYHYR